MKLGRYNSNIQHSHEILQNQLKPLMSYQQKMV